MPSRFFGKDLLALNEEDKSHSSPLSVICHLDLDSFYAQCEQVRLNLSKTDPVVCLQWQGLIAVSYAARRFGISRHETMIDAKKKCPDIIFAHVATFKKGHTQYSYNNNERPNIQLHKVSLNPYRQESRKIFQIIHRSVKKMEKASIDEVYIDLGDLVYEELMKLFPQLTNIDSDSKLPDPPKIADLPDGLGWSGRVIGSQNDEYLDETVGLELYKFDESKENRLKELKEKNTTEGVLVDTSIRAEQEQKQDSKTDLISKYEQKMSKSQTEAKEEEKVEEKNAPLEINDWDDVCLMIGSQIAKKIRQNILNELQYTCSVGISRNKTLSKLASGILKPATQNIVRSSAILGFLTRFEITDVGGLGGKTGDELMKKLNIPKKGSMPYLLNLTRNQIQKQISPKLTKRVMNIVRGTEYNPLENRQNVKSMASVKNFTKYPLKTHKDAVEWLKVYAADLAGRISELCEEKDKELNSEYIVSPIVHLYPKTISLSLKSEHRTAQFQRQTAFPSGVIRKNLANALFETACKILKQMEAECEGANSRTPLYPCERLQLLIHGFIFNTNVGAPGSAQIPLSSFFKDSPNRSSSKASSTLPTSSPKPKLESKPSESPEKSTLSKSLNSASSRFHAQQNAFLVDDDEDDENNAVPDSLNNKTQETEKSAEGKQELKVNTSKTDSHDTSDFVDDSVSKSDEKHQDLSFGSSFLFRGRKKETNNSLESATKSLSLSLPVSGINTSTPCDSPSHSKNTSTSSNSFLSHLVSGESEVDAESNGQDDNNSFSKNEEIFVESKNTPKSDLTVRCSRCKHDIALEDLFAHEDWHNDQDALKALKRGSTALTTFFKPQGSFKATPQGEKPKLLDGGIPKPIKLTKRPPPPSSKKNTKDPKKPKLSKNQTFLSFE